VGAAISLPWSNGQVEGHIDRLKTLKRQMYGRAGFELLKRRVLGASRLARWLRAHGVRRSEELAGKVLEAAKAQHTEPPAAEAKGALASEMAAEVLKARECVAALDARLEELVSAKPEAEVVKSLPSLGPLFTAKFLAEVGDVRRFASADSLGAGGASFQRRARRGNRTLKNQLYRLALSCIVHHGPSRAYYERKRAEGKAYNQA
jgi:transposase